jgi:hypothetical protein
MRSRPPRGQDWRKGGGDNIFRNRFSYENRSLPILMMGWKPPYPLLRWIPPPRRAPYGGLNYRISWKPYLPRKGP